MNASEMIARCCLDDSDAMRLCSAWLAHVHLWDDVLDGDRPVPVQDEEMVQVNLAWWLETQTNPFWIAHKHRLIPIVELAYTAWLDSNRWADSPDSYRRLAADVIKGFYHEFIFAVARIKGGWAHLRDCTSVLREYDFETAAPAVTPDNPEPENN